MIAPLRVVAVTGAPGVGKTEVAARLSRRYAHPCAMIDTDWLSCTWPWREQDALDLIAANLAPILSRYRRWGAQTVVVSGVMLPGRLLPKLSSVLTDHDLTWVFYGLRARRETIDARIGGCLAVQDPALRRSMAHLDSEVAEVPDVRQVQTDGRTLAEVVDEICASEARDGLPMIGAPAQPAPPATGGVEIPVQTLRTMAAGALTRRGVSAQAARACADALLSAQAAGLASHGLVRLPEYCHALDRGELDATARPTTSRLGPASLLVHGQRSLGVLTARAIQDALIEVGRGATPGVVAVRGGGHLGRLADVVRPVASAGLVVLGFVNYGGTGQKVAPAGSGAGRIGTNPVVFACPADDGNPVVVDLSTSAWSEGAVRVAAAAGGMLPGGVLVDRAGHDVYDPARLYDQPPSAALAPLGTGPGGTAHKGYALAVMVELLAGALAGAGVCADPAPDGVGGNGGLFLALRARHLGRSDAQLRADVRALEAHLSAADPVAAGCAVRLPGRGAARPCPETVPLPQYLVDDLVALAGRRTAFG